MANQFTKGTRIKHDESTKDKIRAEMLARRLFKFAKSKGEKRKDLEMSQAQVAAARVLIERGKPALQAVEQTNINPIDQLSEDEVEALIRSLISSNPGLIHRLGIGLRAVDAVQNEPNSCAAPTKESA